jgi:hypothetical protein
MMLDQHNRGIALATRGIVARACAILGLAFVALSATPADAATCEWAIRFATDIVDYGERASSSEDYILARRTASDARMIAVDAAREAKGCGCPEAIASLENVGQQSHYSGNAQNLTAAQQYGRKIKAYGEEALATLRKCPGN